MISILIPIYNVKVVKLVDELISQCRKAKIAFEIICLDDLSKQAIKEHNGVINGRMGVNYVELSENIGRAKIRNRLSKLARYDWLLFLDCDAKIPHKKFVKNYISTFKEPAAIIGGTIYQKKAPQNPDKRLHWYYGRKREALKASKRNKHPARYFHTHNFCVARDVIWKYPFDEKVTGYGYEDLMLGESLKEAGIPIYHLDNQTIHRGLKKSQQFLTDQKSAIDNLASLFYADNIQDTRLINFYLRVKKTGFLKAMVNWIEPRQEKIENQLIEHPNRLYLLDVLKLYYFDKRIRGKLKQGAEHVSPT